MNVPDDLRYSADHEWARLEDGLVRVGITDYAQDALGDVVFVQVPTIGTDGEGGRPRQRSRVHEVGVGHLRADHGHHRGGERRPRRRAAADQRRPIRRRLDLRHRVRRTPGDLESLLDATRTRRSSRDDWWLRPDVHLQQLRSPEPGRLQLLLVMRRSARRRARGADHHVSSRRPVSRTRPVRPMTPP